MTNQTDNPITLAVLAAGAGRRYGGLKQLDGVGPSNETVMDYAIYDALRAGFRKIVFIIRKDFEESFQETIEQRLGDKIEAHYVCQELSDLPQGFTAPNHRTKPWGTAHALWCCRDVIQEPFGVINADDFYGRHSYEQLAQALKNIRSTTDLSALVAFKLRNTLSEHGQVSRGICELNEDQLLHTVVERSSITGVNGGAQYAIDGENFLLTGEEPVSMNMWAFTHAIFSHLEEGFIQFLNKYIHDAECEFYIPTIINDLVSRDSLRTQVTWSTERWLGMTYPEDKKHVTQGIRKHVVDGMYPAALWA